MPDDISDAAVATADANSDKSTVNSVLKALSVLECFSAETPEYPVAELARMTRINKATCHRLVATMVKAGWLVRTPEANYRPTLKVFRIGSPALGGIDLRDQTRDKLRELAEEFGDTGYLMVPDEDRAVCLDVVQGKNPVRVYVVDVGSSLPLHVGGAPIAMLAFRDDLLARMPADTLAKLTPKTASTMRSLRRVLAETRERGYSLSHEDIVPGVSAVGAPIRDADGTVVGALSLGGLASRFEPPRREAIVEGVVTAAAAVSERLGWVDPTR